MQHPRLDVACWVAVAAASVACVTQAASSALSGAERGSLVGQATVQVELLRAPHLSLVPACQDL
jgi:hypothetical protein